MDEEVVESAREGHYGTQVIHKLTRVCDLEAKGVCACVHACVCVCV